MEVKIILDTLMADSAALPQSENNRLFNTVLEDYAEETSRRKKVDKVKENPYFNALQVKFSYALTCHKTQGGQWDTVFIDQCQLNDRTLEPEFIRWLYTAVTRSTKKLYLVNFDDRYFD